MSVQPSGFLYPQDLPDAIQRLKVATAGDQRAAIALDVVLLQLESRDSEDVRELKARFAIITVRSGNGRAAPVVERVPGGWQSGAHHYADSEVLDVQELHLVAQDAAAAVRPEKGYPT